MNSITISSGEVVSTGVGIGSFRPSRRPQKTIMSTNLDMMNWLWGVIMLPLVWTWYILRYGVYNLLRAAVVVLGLGIVTIAVDGPLNPGMYKVRGEDSIKMLWVLWSAFGAAFCCLMSWAGRPRHYQLQMMFVGTHFAAVIAAVIWANIKWSPIEEANAITLIIASLYAMVNAIEMFANWRNANS